MKFLRAQNIESKLSGLPIKHRYACLSRNKENTFITKPYKDTASCEVSQQLPVQFFRCGMLGSAT